MKLIASKKMFVDRFTSWPEFVESDPGLLLLLLHAIIIFYFLDLRFGEGNDTERKGKILR